MVQRRTNMEGERKARQEKSEDVHVQVGSSTQLVCGHSAGKCWQQQSGKVDSHVQRLSQAPQLPVCSSGQPALPSPP